MEFKSSAMHFKAETQDGNSKCTADNSINPIGCTLVNLKPATHYLVKAKACADTAFTIDCSDEVTADQWTAPLRK